MTTKTGWSLMMPDHEAAQALKAARPGVRRALIAPVVLHDRELPRMRDYFARTVNLAPYTVTSRVSHHLDMGGMIHKDAHTHRTVFQGLPMTVYSIHVEMLQLGIASSETRRSGLIYTPTWPMPMAITPDQRTELLAWLAGIAADAACWADAENEQHNRDFANAPPNVAVAPRPVRGGGGVES